MKKIIRVFTSKQKEQPQQLPFETKANELIYRGTKQEIPFIKKNITNPAGNIRRSKLQLMFFIGSYYGSSIQGPVSTGPFKEA